MLCLYLIRVFLCLLFASFLFFPRLASFPVLLFVFIVVVFVAKTHFVNFISFAFYFHYILNFVCVSL